MKEFLVAVVLMPLMLIMVLMQFNTMMLHLKINEVQTVAYDVREEMSLNGGMSASKILAKEKALSNFLSSGKDPTNSSRRVKITRHAGTGDEGSVERVMPGSTFTDANKVGFNLRAEIADVIPFPGIFGIDPADNKVVVVIDEKTMSEYSVN